MSEELKACPFCGGEAHLGYADQTGQGWRVVCLKCDATNGYFHSAKGAIAAWNARANPAPQSPKESEAEIMLGAWHRIFGTTQLTHAQARLEAAEREVERLKHKLEAAPQVSAEGWLGEEEIKEMRPTDPQAEVVRVLIGRKKYESMLNMALAAIRMKGER